MEKYLDYKFSSNQNQSKDKSDVHNFKLQYDDNFSHHIKNKISKLCKEFCNIYIYIYVYIIYIIYIIYIYILYIYIYH